MSLYAATLADIRAAAERVSGQVHRTPVMTCSALDRVAGRRLFLKCENLQRGGSFKLRGALNAVLRIPPQDAARGVVAHSSGNHAQAVAIAAGIRGITSHVVMPEDSARVKVRAVRGYGGLVVPCRPEPGDRARVAKAIQATTGATEIPSYDHPDVIAGQGTVGLELAEQVPVLHVVVVPVGGGGLVSGIALALRELVPGLRVVAAEPAGADDAARSKGCGRLLPQDAPMTIADGLRTGLGRHTWPVVRDVVERVVVVDDPTIVAAMRLVWERMKLVVEPSAAVAVAAALWGDIGPGKRVGVVLSGGNVDLDGLPW